MVELQHRGRWRLGGKAGGATPALALPSCGLPPPGVILVGSVATKTRDPWMPEKATGKRESWLQKPGSVVHGFHASLFCLGQVSSDHRAFALVAPLAPAILPQMLTWFPPHLFVQVPA